MEDGDRDDWIACITHTHEEKRGTSWCGRFLVGEFYLVNIDHAAYLAMDGARTRACLMCVEAVKRALNDSREDDETRDD